MAKLIAAAEMVEEMLFGGAEAGLRILGAEYDKSTGTVTFHVEGKNCPEGDEQVTAQFSKIHGINGTYAINFDGLFPVDRPAENRCDEYPDSI